MIRSALLVLILLPFVGGRAEALPALFPIFGKLKLDRLNNDLAGQVLDFTNHHGRDNRIFSPALQQRRDLYVYLPPGYDGAKRFPIILWLHGANQDARGFLELAPHFDRAIRQGDLPPVVVVAPDGSMRTRNNLFKSGTFFLNSKAGNYEDQLIGEVWPWALSTFAVRPEREAHVIAGASMGGGAAFNLAFKHKDQFRHVVGIHPPLNLRWTDCHGNYFGNYRPDCVGVRDWFPPMQVIARYYGVILVRQRRLIGPIAGRGLTAVQFIARENPIEMLDPYAVRPDDFEMFIGYGTKDQFNIDAEVEHFVDEAARRGIHPHVVRLEGGRHIVRDGVKLLPDLCRWLHPRLAPYAPGSEAPGCAPVPTNPFPVIPPPPGRKLRER